jgi:hypothetical protein
VVDQVQRLAADGVRPGRARQREPLGHGVRLGGGGDCRGGGRWTRQHGRGDNKGGRRGGHARLVVRDLCRTKHSAATRASVTASVDGDRLLLRVRDDGIGGADPAAGTGLVGLADRVAAVDGTMALSSPAGGPTVLQIEFAGMPLDAR